MHIPELLAPAGSKEALIAAVENGADAVYFGGTIFSARQYASNFTREELEWAIDYAHIRGVKAYATVNTLIKDSELEEACDYLQFLCNAGADAVIVQDLGILHLLREQLPELAVHASTQMTIHNAQGVEFLKEMGVKRVVLARELALDEIRGIRSQTGMEIETFIHGALCFSYSGQCLLSSMIGGRSGNRGYCAQPCRKKYRIDEIEGYLLSPKDLNMSEHIPALVEAGIDSFKIEGRMKRPEYVAGVVRVYRKLIDRYIEAPSDFCVTEDEKYMLRQLFNRDFTTWYFFGNPGGNLMSREYPHNRGTELGKVLAFEPRKKMASIYLKSNLRAGDGIGAKRRETGFIIRNMFIDNRKVNQANPGSTVKIFLEDEVKKGETVFKTYDSRLMTSLETANVRKIPVKMRFKARINEPVNLCISEGENDILILGDTVRKAQSHPVTVRSVSDQLNKLGNTVFKAVDIIFEMDENIFIPVSELNSLRRSAIAKLERTRIEKWKRRCNKPEIPSGIKKLGTRPVLSVNTGSIEGLKAAVDGGADVVYIGDEVAEPEKEDYDHAVEYGRKKGVSVYFNTPRIVKDVSGLNMDYDTDGFLVSNPGVLKRLRTTGKGMQIVIDYPFNVLNRVTLGCLLNYSQRVTLSPELTLEEIRSLTPFGPTECIVHGFFPLMVSKHDLAGCLFPSDQPRRIFLKDEKGFIFPVYTDVGRRTYIMNSRELCMFEYVPRVIEAGVSCLRIEARTFDKDYTGEITRAYREAIDNTIAGKKIRNHTIEGEFTTGHYFRGVM